MSVQGLFNQYASEYDEARKRLVPCFDDFYQTVIDIVPFDREQRIVVLDLGAGTGLMTALLAATFVNAHFTLVDLADRMLDVARKRLNEFGRRFSFSTADYAGPGKITGECDLVVSGLSIHHLDDHRKERLFQAVFQHLKPGGLFINADQVLGETPEIDQIYRSKWISKVRYLGSSEEEIRAAFERMKADKMSTLSHQLGALEKTGFSQVNCWFKQYSFVVYSGQKPA